MTPRKLRLTRQVANEVIELVASQHYVSALLIAGPSRAAALVCARVHISQLLAARGYSTPQIGRVLNRDHTTIVYYLGGYARRKCRAAERPVIPPKPKAAWHAPAVTDITGPKVLRWRIPYAGAESAFNGYARVPYGRTAS